MQFQLWPGLEATYSNLSGLFHDFNKEVTFVVSIGNLTRDVLVNAPAYVAKADVANAVHGPHLKWFYPDWFWRPKKFAHIHPNLKYIPELREYEFTINPKYVKR